jgi:peroxiredoxin
MQYLLIAAGFYNIVWGGIAFVRPNYFLEKLHMHFANDHWISKAIGLLEIIFGIAYIIASRKPFKHWLIIFIGFVVKLVVSVGYLYYMYAELIPQQLISMVLANDMVWLLPFGLILYQTFEHYQSTKELEAYDMNPRKLKSLGNIYTNQGSSLQEHADASPTMLVFLRHFGCPFCREMLSEIQHNRAQIEKEGTKIVLVHLVDDAKAEEITSHFGLQDLPRISDPNKRIYKAFGLSRGNLEQLFGFNVLVRGVMHTILKLNPPRPIMGDAFQMPGIFVIHKGMVIHTFKHTSLADRPDYIELARSR